MKISLNWLTDYVDVSMPAKALAELFTRIGFGCEDIQETASDVVLDLEITSNRPDMLGHIGVARELSAVTAPLKLPRVGKLPTSGKVADFTRVEVLDSRLCPRYTARVIRGVKVGPSPSWLVERLDAVGLRSVNNVVDVTNFILFEYSQPLHCFDHDKLAGGRIVVRPARGDEVMVSIDGTSCRLSPEMLVIADAEKPVAIAGIMGGLNSEVTEKTVNVLIESAQFDPLTTRQTSRKLALMSDSNYRFERGVDPVGVDEASLRACKLILDVAGGKLADGIIDVWAKPYAAPKVTLRPARCDALLGTKVPPERQMDILQRIGLSPKMEGKAIACSIPPHRPDLRREADLIEEIARLHGYDNIPVNEQVTHKVQAEGLPQRTRRKVGAVLAAAGFDEAIAPAFIDADEGAMFGFASPVCVDKLVRKANNALRPTLLPSLLKVCKSNQDAGNSDVSLFELASVFPPSARAALLDERVEIAMVTTKELRDLRGAVEALLAQLDAEAQAEIRPADVPGMANGEAGEIWLDGKVIGAIGSVDHKVAGHYGLERPACAASILFDPVLAAAGKVRVYQPLPRFPSVMRDISFIVDDSAAWRKIEESIAAVDQPLRASIDYVTTYRGKPIPAGCKSVTVRLTYRSPSGTLRSEEVDAQANQIIAAVKKSLAAEVRA